MKITELRIENFRCFKKAKLRIAPVTLITGANSAGKSSLVAPLLAWAQTDGMPALFSPNGRHVEMGDFREMVHGGSDGDEIGVGFDMDASPDSDSRFVVNATFGEGMTSGLGMRAIEIEGSYYRVHVKPSEAEYKMTYEVNPGDSVILDKIAKIGKPAKVSKASADPDSDTLFEVLKAVTAQFVLSSGKSGPRQFKIIDRDEPLAGSVPLSEPAEMFKAVSRNQDLLQSLTWYRIAELAQALRDKLTFISSFRLAPRRTYYEVAKADLAVGRHGENYVEQIAQWTSANAQELDSLRNDLDELGILSALKIDRLGAGRMELKGKPKQSSRLTNLTDLGFGTSQVLPVLVAINQLTPGSVLVVAQPETHLHPEPQARLASYFVRLAKERDITFIVETHSEYLINRLRRLVSTGEIAEHDVSVAHVENTGREAQVHAVELRADGQIVGAPEDFFETHMMDVMKLAMGE